MSYLVFLGGFLLFCLKALHHIKKYLGYDGLSEQEKIGQQSPLNCLKIGHLYEAFSYKPALPKYIHSSLFERKSF